MGDRVLLLFFLQVIVCKIHKALPVKFLNGMTALTDMIKVCQAETFGPE